MPTQTVANQSELHSSAHSAHSLIANGKPGSVWSMLTPYKSVLEAMRGIMSQAKLTDPQSYERANDVKIIQGYRRARA